MRHAVLGAGGVGSFLGASLARAGRDVLLLMREQSLARYDGVLIADSVGLGKTWIGKKLLEDFAYHRRQKAVVVCPASLREMWRQWCLK